MFRWTQSDESGAATAELVVITPLLLLLLMLVIQLALWQHADHIVESAAREGVRAARLQGGSAQSGQLEAESFLAELGGQVVTSPQVSVSRDATSTAVTVTGYAEEVVPGMHLRVRATSRGPLEVVR